VSIWVREFKCNYCGQRHRVEGERRHLGKLQKEAEEDCENYDPTPYCSGCGSMTKANCNCGPIADND